MGKTTAIKLDEISGRYDRSAVQQNAIVNRSAEWADIIALTEINEHDRASACHTAGFTLSRDGSLPGGNSGDTGILSRDKTWEVRAAKTVVIGPDLGPGGQVCATMVALRHRVTKVRLVVTVAHMPSGVEGDWKTKGKQYNAMVVKWRAAVRRFARLHMARNIIFTGDFNLNAHRVWVQDYLDEAFITCLVQPLPEGGSHEGGRLIDLFLTSSRICRTRWTILPAHPATDHRAVRLEAATS